MEKSNLISSVILKLKLAYPVFFSTLSDEELIALAQMYKDELNTYNESTLNRAIKSVIRNNKYMPSLNEIINECEKNKVHNANRIIEKMKADGYFKTPEELDKALKFIDENNIPSWLKEDMKRYTTLEIANNNLMIEG